MPDSEPTPQPERRLVTTQPRLDASTPLSVSTDLHVPETSDDLATGAVPDSPPGYELLGELARGGMGVVYRARDTRFDREVAVKLIGEKYRHDADARTRFLAEARITGRLQHPGVPPVHDLGTLADGRPYLAMKLITGRTLDAILASDARPNLIAVFEAICQAIAYAHARGVIHRDLKPLNVMVGAFGEVQVMDWGLAKEASASRVSHDPGDPTEPDRVAATRSGAGDDAETAAGTVMGTPAYMAPEQARGETDRVDARADVFGLGAILCAVLTGRPPFEPDDGRSTLAVAQAGDLTRAFDRLDRCGADADLIALGKRCLAADPESRPMHAGAVAEAVRVHLAGVDERLRAAERAAVVAVVERRKRRAMQWAAGVVAAVLLLGITGTSVGLARAEIRRGEAVKAQADEATQRQIAQIKEREANDEKINAQNAAVAEKAARMKETEERKYADAIANFVIDDFLALTSLRGQDLFAGADRVPLDRNLTLRQMLDRAAEKLDRRTDLAPRTEADLREIIGINYREQGEFHRAIAYLERCVALRRQMLGTDHSDTLDAANSLGVAYRAAGRLPEAIRLLEQVRDARVTNLGADHPRTLTTFTNLATAYKAAGRLPEAIELFKRVRDVQVTVFGPDHPENLTTLVALAQAYRAADRLPEAIELLEQVRDAFVNKLGADHPSTLNALDSLAVAYWAAGRLPEAIKIFEQVRDLSVTKLGADHHDTLATLANLATAYRTVGRLPEAIKLFEQVRDAYVNKPGVDHPDTLVILMNLASTYQITGRLPEAVAIYEQARDNFVTKLGADHPHTLTMLHDMAGAYRSTGRLPEAIKLLERVRDARVTKLGADHPDTLITLASLATAYRDAGRLPEAIELLEQVRDVRVTKLGADHPSTLTTLNSLAETYWVAGRLPEAIALFDKAAVGIEKRRFLHEHAARITTNTIQAYEQVGQFEKAEGWRRKWLAVVKQQTGAEHPAYAGELAFLASNLLRQSKWADAEATLRECLTIREKAQPEAWTTFNTKSLLGGALLGQKKYADAEPLLLAGYEGMKQREKTIPPASRPRLPEAIDRLIDLYTATDKPDEVAKWRAERAKHPFIAPPPREVKR